MTTSSSKSPPWPKRISGKQLRDVVATYAAALPGWETMKGGHAIFRVTFPIQQQIGFEALRTGDYRPAHAIRCLPMKLSTALHQLLNIRIQQLSLNQHERRWQEALSAMEREFEPTIRAPLVLEQVLRTCEAEGRGRIHNLTMLATLYAWQGNSAHAVELCKLMTALPSHNPAAPHWSELAMKSFGRELLAAVEGGTERAFLQSSAERPYPTEPDTP